MPDTSGARLMMIRRLARDVADRHERQLLTDLLAMIDQQAAENGDLLGTVLKQSALLASRCWGCGHPITAEMRERDDIAGGMVVAESGRVWCWGCTITHAPEPCRCGLVHDLGAGMPGGDLVSRSEFFNQVGPELTVTASCLRCRFNHHERYAPFCVCAHPDSKGRGDGGRAELKEEHTPYWCPFGPFVAVRERDLNALSREVTP